MKREWYPMNEKEFNALINRYLRGKSTEKEEKLLNELFDTHAQEKEWFVMHGIDEIKLEKSLRKKVRRAINSQEKPTKNKSISYGTVLFTILILLAGIATTVYFLQPLPSGRLVMKSTASGQKLTVTLSDGSTVRLNAESSITYPEVFSEERREIQLTGEAYFSVRENNDKPFIVNSGNIQTSVLGTAFNVNARDSAHISVALVSGKVQVKSLASESEGQSKAFYLAPGQCANYSRESGRFTIAPFNKEKLIAWKDGIIYFSAASHEQVFNQLARWYGVEFVFENSPEEEWEVTGEFKDMSLELLLNTISNAKGFTFQMQKDTVLISFDHQ
jgi:transmembrane sensor